MYAKVLLEEGYTDGVVRTTPGKGSVAIKVGIVPGRKRWALYVERRGPEGNWNDVVAFFYDKDRAESFLTALYDTTDPKDPDALD